MVFLPHLGCRGSLRKTCKIRAFGPPKSTLGPVFASQNTVKNVSFVGYEAEKRRLLQCFSTRKAPFFRFSLGKCICFTGFSKLSSAVAKMTYFTDISSLSSAFAKSAFLAKSHLSRKSRILYASHSPPRCRGRAAPFGGGVPVHGKTLFLVASTVSHSPAFPR